LVPAYQPPLVPQPGRHPAVADFARVAQFVEVEQLRRERVAAGMSLTTRPIDPHLEPGFLRHRLPPGSAPAPPSLGGALLPRPSLRLAGWAVAFPSGPY